MGSADDESTNAGRAVLVTGAASGIGRATALKFAESGERVCCFDRDEAGVEGTASAIRDAGGEAFAVVGDVSDEDATRDVIARTVESFGSLDVLANVAGIGHFRHSAEETLIDWDRIIGVNLTGTFLMCRGAIPELLKRPGVIVNVASIAGLAAQAYAAAYSASKAGVIALSKTLAAEYASQGLRVNAVCPGAVMTPIIDCFAAPEDADQMLVSRAAPLMGQMLDPSEVANAITFLASEDMPNTTGSVLVVDGGTVA